MFRNRLLAVSSLALASLFAAANPASAATYFVDPVAGSDSNPGTQELPFKTITHGINAPSPEGELLNINLAAGTYSQSSGESFGWIFGGYSGPVTVVGAGVGASVIDAGGTASCMSPTNASVDFDSLSFKNCSFLVSGASVTFNNTALENFYSSLRTQSAVVIQNSFISGTSGFFVDQQSSLSLTNTDVDGAGSLASDFIVLVQQSTLRADDLFIYNLVVSDLVLHVLHGSMAEFTNSTIQDSWGTINNSLGDPITLRAVGAGSTLRLINSRVNRSAGIAILGDSGSIIAIDGGSYIGNKIGVYGYNAVTYLNNDLDVASTARFNSTVANWRVSGPDALAWIEQGIFIGGTGTYGIQSYNNARITAINSRFRVTHAFQFESIDEKQGYLTLGRNIWFIDNGDINYSAVVANCTQPVPLFVGGNSTWIRNVQAADARGKIAPQTIAGPQKGRNYWLKNSNCRLATF